MQLNQAFAPLVARACSGPDAATLPPEQAALCALLYGGPPTSRAAQALDVLQTQAAAVAHTAVQAAQTLVAALAVPAAGPTPGQPAEPSAVDGNMYCPLRVPSLVEFGAAAALFGLGLWGLPRLQQALARRDLTRPAAPASPTDARRTSPAPSDSGRGARSQVGVGGPHHVLHGESSEPSTAAPDSGRPPARGGDTAASGGVEARRLTADGPWDDGHGFLYSSRAGPEEAVSEADSSEPSSDLSSDPEDDVDGGWKNVPHHSQ